jgi:hypothetical protein
MFRKRAIQNHIIYAETSKMCRDFLLEKFRSSNPDIQPTTGSSWSNVLSNLSDLESIEFVQNALCLHCVNFIIELLARSIQQGNSTETVRPAADIIYGEPRVRKMNVVSDAAAKGCWVCTHVIRNARREENDKIAAALVSLQAFNFSPDEFSVCAYGRKRWHFYTAEFRLSAVQSTHASPSIAFRLTSH